MSRRVYLATRDLLFRSKLGAVVAAAGGEISRDEAACDLAVLDVDDRDIVGRIGKLVTQGIPVLAYGSHVRPALLAAARAAGATAVPNSQVLERLAEMIGAKP